MISRSKLFAGSVAAVALFGAGAVVGYWWSVLRSEPGTYDDEARRESSTKDERPVLYWHDPMVPGVKFDKPGKSPFMDMDLVPVYGDDAGRAAVRIDPIVTQSLGIRIGKVERAVVRSRLAAVGSVAYDERLLQVVPARVDGYVKRLHVKTSLDFVRRGQPLADIVAPEWLAAQEEYLALLDAESERGRSLRAAARQRLAVLGVPEATVRDIERRRRTNTATTLFAPIDGVLTEIAVREGAAFTPGVPLFRINGLATVWVNGQVPEAQVSMIPTGSAVEARASAWPGTRFEGDVLALLPEVDLQSRTLRVRIAVDNPDFKLSPGMFVALEFVGEAGEPQLVVPTEAVIMTGERNVVIVAREEGGGFDVAEVTVGADVDGRTVVLAGLQEGQSIVLSGQFLIDSEASLKSTVARIASAAPDGSRPQDAVGDVHGSGQGDGNARPVHLTQGTITAIAPEAITIAHDPVPSLHWGPMTMPFQPPAKGVPPGLKVGDRVSFSFAPTGQGGYRIDSITLLDRAPAPEPRL